MCRESSNHRTISNGCLILKKIQTQLQSYLSLQFKTQSVSPLHPFTHLALATEQPAFSASLAKLRPKEPTNTRRTSAIHFFIKPPMK